MGRRQVVVTQKAAENIAAISWYIESKGLLATAEKFADDIYDHFIKISDSRKNYRVCREPSRALLGYKCLPYKKKYTIIFFESDDEIIITEFISSKLIKW
jgi:plasmid stabilization system protein ParE